MMDSDTQHQRGGARVLLLASLLVLVALAVGLYLTCDCDGPQSTRPQAELAYLNLGPETAYVGSAACKDCHEDQHKGHFGTPHGRSLRGVDVAAKALPGALVHEPSGLAYRIEAKGGAVQVQEILPLEGGGSEVLSDHPLAFELGSGDHVQCYLSEVDGFLVQAPIARSGDAWTLAPGYDRPLHGSFSRPVGRSCLGCHAGRVTNVEDSLHRIQFHERAIGCERCHGPGSLHVTHQEKLALNTDAKPSKSGAVDLTIVNPARLTREGSLDVCAQCHLDEGMTVQRTGHNIANWRPGLPLSDFRITYRPRTPDGEVPVVGRLQQLRASACFDGSADLSCTTCHEAHTKPSPAQRASYYSNKCATCHGSDACGLEADARRQAEDGDDCTTCHMPRADERLHHGVFTNHRVGLHGPQSAPGPLVVGEQLELVQLENTPTRSAAEGQRDLALAWVRLPMWRPAGRVKGALLSPAATKLVVKKALSLLRKLESNDALDPDSAVALATLNSRQETANAVELLRGLLDGKQPLREETRGQALAVMARSLLERGKAPEALAVMERLTGLRRSVQDWDFVADLARQLKDRAHLVRAVEAVLSIAPQMESSHYLAAEVFSDLGEPDRAKHHQRIALQLARHLASEREKRQR